MALVKRTWRLPRLTVWRVVLCISCLFAGLRLASLPLLELYDMKVLDLRQRLRGPISTSGVVVIVAIDEASLAELGRWPWPRARLATLVDRLTEGGARAIGFDILFDQPDPSLDHETLHHVLETEPQSATELEATLLAYNDARMAAALRASGRVVLAHFFELGPTGPETPTTGDPAGIPEITAQVTPDANVGVIPTATGFHGNIPVLAGAAAGTGHYNFLPDGDGAFRRVPMVVRLGTRYTGAFSLETLRRFAGGAAATMTVEGYGVGALRVGASVIPVDEAGEFWINYLGPEESTFPYIRASDVIAGRMPAGEVDGKIVLVALTAIGSDRRASPFSTEMPAVEAHATTIDNILQGRALLRPSWIVPLEAGVVLLLGVLVALLLRIPGAWGFWATVGLLVAYAWGTQQLFERRGLVLSALYPLGAIGFAMLGGGVVRYLGEEREKRWIRDTFRRYLNPEVLEQLAREPERVRLGGEAREVTIFFSDIRSFTTISETLQRQAGPEAVADLMNEYLTAMTKILFEHEGLLDKYIGDAVMAFWGAPVVVPDHAARACQAALHMLDALARLNEGWRGRGWPLVAIGVGIATGEVVVGNFGSETRFNYTIMGDYVNLASRLEGLNKTYHTRILLSETTQRAVAGEFVCREVDRVEVKGKHQSVAIYELLGPLAADTDGSRRRLAADFAEALAAYRARDWDGAEARIARLTADWDGDGPTAELARRIRELRASPPGEEWDGVYRPKEK